jgi:hypothetical protein
VIRDRILFLARNPRAGHERKDLTDLPVRFFPVYSYLIVYRPETTPLPIVAILHGRREVEKILPKRPSYRVAPVGESHPVASCATRVGQPATTFIL